MRLKLFDADGKPYSEAQLNARRVWLEAIATKRAKTGYSPKQKAAQKAWGERMKAAKARNKAAKLEKPELPPGEVAAAIASHMPKGTLDGV